jgi:hypothetical protein
LIGGEVQHAYNPTSGYVLTGTFTLEDQMYMAPRLSSMVTRVNSRRSTRRIHGIGSAVVDLIFSIANRDVTFLSGTAAISRL